jgi:hypothetical protein
VGLIGNMLIILVYFQQRKYDPTVFDCTSYFSGDDPLKALPEDYQDLKTIVEIRVRKQELDHGLTSESSSQIDSPTGEDSGS